MIYILILFILIVTLGLTIKLFKSTNKKIGLIIYILLIVVMIFSVVLGLFNGTAFTPPEKPSISFKIPIA